MLISVESHAGCSFQPTLFAYLILKLGYPQQLIVFVEPLAQPRLVLDREFIHLFKIEVDLLIQIEIDDCTRIDVEIDQVFILGVFLQIGLQQFRGLIVSGEKVEIPAYVVDLLRFQRRQW
jgi:hypothetical protein